jgi:hypothetical protein
MPQAGALVAKRARRSGGTFAVHRFYLPGACAVAGILTRQDVHHVHDHFGTNSADIEQMDNAAQRIVLERHDIACETRKLAGHFLQVVGERAHALGR